jgi:hypothetical protein
MHRKRLRPAPVTLRSAEGSCLQYPVRLIAQHGSTRQCSSWGPPRFFGGPQNDDVVSSVVNPFNGTYPNSSRITFPPFAIFIGRPLLAVNSVASEIPIVWQTVAIRSSLE